MKYLSIAAFAVLSACAVPVEQPARDDLGLAASGYFTSQHEFAAWLHVGCYEGQERKPATWCD